MLKTKMRNKTKTKKINSNSFADKSKKTARKNYLGLFNRVLACLILISGVYFIISINDLSIKSFVLQDLQVKVSELKNKNQAVELEVMQLQSYENISQRAKNNKMIKVADVDYITVMSGVVAQK